MVDADREILGDPALRAVMIANAAEMYRQGNGGIYDEAICMARPWGFPVEGVSVPVRIWHGALDLAVPVGMGHYLERTLPNAVATYYPHEGHHFVYDRWREILGVLVAEATSASARTHAAAHSSPTVAVPAPQGVPTRMAPTLLEGEAQV
jgi:pimeloyl-ACP methyl ester carboxylesterase